MSAPGHPNNDHAPIAVDDVGGIEIRIAKLRGSRKHARRAADCFGGDPCVACRACKAGVAEQDLDRC